jgi:hypothetical protein
VQVTSKWGWCIGPAEARAICDALATAINATTGRFNYVEVGLGFGVTFESIRAILERLQPDYHMAGIDIKGCQLAQRCEPKCFVTHEGSEAYFKKRLGAIHFAFIDGCHGKPCVMRDFMDVEPFIPAGGVVVFHDTDANCQNTHTQPHCQTGIQARAAVQELGLLDDTRPGWKKLAETSGDSTHDWNGVLVVQRN